MSFEQKNPRNYTLGLLGRKVGMTRIFTSEGYSIAVTVIDVSNNRITQIKSIKSDGYNAIQILFGSCSRSSITKSIAGHILKAGVEIGKIFKEFRISDKNIEKFSIGSIIEANIFNIGDKVDVKGISIGKGYAGTIKRHNFKSGRASHGNSKSHNVPGSIGMAQDPGRIFPGKRMSGHMGNENITIQNLKIIKIDLLRKLLIIKGSIPGSKGGIVIITPSIKGVI